MIRRPFVTLGAVLLAALATACGPTTTSTDVTEVVPTIPTSDLDSILEPPSPSETAASTQAPDGGSENGSDNGSDDNSDGESGGGSDSESDGESGGGSATTQKPKPTSAPASTEATTTTVKPRKLYEVVPAPVLPTDHTPPFPKSGPLPDGTYWVVFQEFGKPTDGGAPTAKVTLYQAFFGSECVSKAKALGDECTNDLYVPASPSRTLSAIPFKSDVTITVADSATQKNYYVTTAELEKILTGPPSAGAPKDFAYTGFAYLMRIRSGQIARFRQVWTP